MIDLFQTGAYLRVPGGNVERPDIQMPVISWAALNIGGDVGRDPTVWANQQRIYKAAGLPFGPWLHCRNLGDIDFLIDVGQGWGSPFIGLNIEDIQGDFVDHGISLQDIAQKVAGWPGPVHMATLPWVQNGQGWKVMSRCVAALEIFPDEQHNIFPNGYDPAVVNQCIGHAFEEGLTQVTLMLKTKGWTQTAYGAPFSICHSLYTADDITPTPQAWASWELQGQCVKPTTPPLPIPPVTQLTAKQFPYTGPKYGPNAPGHPQSMNSPTVKGLKRGMIRMGFLLQDLGSATDDYGADLESALEVYQGAAGIKPATGQYGRNTWLSLRSEKLTQGPHKGEYAMDALALRLVRQDALVRCYPHPLGSLSEVCQWLHPTAGLAGNWAIDFCAPGGTKVLAVERATVRKLSGHDPLDGANQTIGIFGWSIHYETADGYRYFSTHYGSRSVSMNQIVEPGQVVGTVGHWPGDPSRSHTHLGVTSPFGQADAKKRIEAISKSPKVAA